MSVGLVLLGAGLGWWVLKVTLLAGSDRTDASGYGQFVLAAVGLVIAVMSLLRDWPSRDHPEPDLDKLADALAVAARAQWTAAAADRGLLHPPPLPIRWRRPTLPVAGPVSGATTARPGAFDPLPGLDRTTSAQLREGTHRTLHRVYGGLASGRLIITGAPGSGKSSAAILLLLDALNFRDRTPSDERAQVPVPVLFTLAGWDPDTTGVHDWLAGKLTELAPLAGRRGREQAAALLAAGRITVILDGLDELPEQHHRTALRALAEQATFRLILLTRTGEIAAAVEHQILTGAACVELRPPSPTDTATYLRHSIPHPPSPAWQRLLDTLTPASTAPVAVALTNPLAITLLRDIYHAPAPPDSPLGAPDELLDTTRFPTPTHITHHLLDHAITIAYTPKPGRPTPSYPPETARHILTVVAQHLRDHETRDLRWWDIPSWIPRTPRVLLVGVPTGLLTGCVAGLALGRTAGFIFGLVLGLVTPLIFGHAEAAQQPSPDRSGYRRTGWQEVALSSLAYGFWGAISAGVVAGVVFSLVSALVFALEDVLKRKLTHTQKPRIQLRIELASTFVGAAASAIRAGSFIGFMSMALGLLAGPTALTVGLGLGLALAVGLGLPLSDGWPVVLGQFYLSSKHSMPVRLLTFLDDAHNRHLLRTVGPVYQFRHATLQDRLAPPPQTNSLRTSAGDTLPA